MTNTSGSDRTVLVTGATGQQGGAVASELIQRGYKVRGLTRDLDSEKAKRLAEIGVDPVVGNFEDQHSLENAVRGVDTVFFMTTPFEKGTDAETKQGLAMIQAITHVGGVDHIVYNSVANADLDTGIPHFDSKYEVEQVLRASELNWTIVAPVYFMDNMFMSGDVVETGGLALGVPEGKTLQKIAVSEIGAFVAAVIDRGESTYKHRYDIASEELTGSEYARILSEVTGRDISFISLPPEAYSDWGEDLVLMSKWFGDVGYTVDIPELQSRFPEVQWQGFRGWAEGRQWT